MDGLGENSEAKRPHDVSLHRHPERCFVTALFRDSLDVKCPNLPSTLEPSVRKDELFYMLSWG